MWGASLAARRARQHCRRVGAPLLPGLRRRSFATSQGSQLQRRVRLLQNLSRAELGTAKEEVTAVHTEATSSEASISSLNLADLCGLCRVLASGGRRPEDAILQQAAARVREALKGNQVPPRETANAAATFALAACEAGHETSLGTEFVDALRSAGVAGSSSGSAVGEDDAGLSGAGAASLALAAASTGRADASIMDALLTRCSAQEVSLSSRNLGDVRLASVLAGKDVMGAIDIRASGFLRTLCGEALFDDPRGVPAELSSGGYPEMLTEFETDVSQALYTAEVPHCQGTIVSGVFVPLASYAKRCAVFPEDTMARATYANAPTQRTAVQRWKMRVVGSAGWRVSVVSEAAWRGLPDAQDKADYVRQQLQEPLDIAEL